MNPTVGSLGVPTGLVGWKILQQKTPVSFPALTQDPVVQREIGYFEQKAPQAATAADLLKDPRLQDFVLTAFGLTSQSGMTALLQKVLESDPSDPKSFAAQMTDSRYTALAKAFNYGGTLTPAVPATPSSADVAFDGLSKGSTFATFSGTFGGVTVSNVDLTGVTSWQGLANTLQSAFRRADGNHSDVSVSLDGEKLQLTDAKGRGSAVAFAWTVNPRNTGPAPTADAPQNLVAGRLAKPAQGGPKVSSPSFIAQVVQQYTQAQYETVIGNTSNALREAVYAQHTLPTVTNWYSIIANRPLADVIQTVLGLPQSFGQLDVDKQVQVFSQRMNIADFQDKAKVNKLLDQFVATSEANTQDPSQTPAAMLLGGAGRSDIINVTMPAPTPIADSYSSASAAAMLLSNAISGYG